MGPNTRWLLEAEHSTGSVQSIDNYDITGDGIKDLIIGRHDGNIEVYAYDEGEDAEPILKYSHVCFFGFWHLTLLAKAQNEMYYRPGQPNWELRLDIPQCGI